MGSFERLTILSRSIKKVKKYVDFRRCQIDIYKIGKTIILCTSFADGEAISKAFFLNVLQLKLVGDELCLLHFIMHDLYQFKKPTFFNVWLAITWFSNEVTLFDQLSKTVLRNYREALVDRCTRILSISQPFRLSFIFFSSQFKKFVMTTRHTSA